MRKRILAVVAVAVAVLVTAGTVAAQSIQRFSDVPPEHEAFEAIEWAAEVELTLGYGDGTFKPAQPLSRRHAVVFMERFYDDILGADGEEGFTSDRFTRADMMVLLKTINDGAPTTKPEPETRWLPRPEGRTAEGRCAHRINDTDFYDWEDCAWGSEDDPAMGRAEMQALTERVWAETSARGKPDNPPALTEGRCFEARAAACYLPSTHTISIESGVTLRSLLHELAHALITGDAVMADCYADWTSLVPHCAHGALFRCAADALYLRYADIDAAGVCGTVPDYGDWTLRTVENIDGAQRIWSVGERGVRGAFTLNIMCTSSGERVVYFHGRGDPAWSDDRYGPSIRWRLGDISEIFISAVSLRDSTTIEEDDYAPLWVLADDDASSLLAHLARLSARGAHGSDHRLIAEMRRALPWGEDGDGAKATLRTTGYHPSMGDCRR